MNIIHYVFCCYNRPTDIDGIDAIEPCLEEGWKAYVTPENIHRVLKSFDEVGICPMPPYLLLITDDSGIV